MNTFGERLKEQREKAGCSQRDLAKMVGKSQNTISCYERGEAHPSKDIMKELADLFGTTYDYLAYGKTTTALPVKMAWADELPPKKEKPVKVYTAPKSDFVQPVPAMGSDQITSQSRPDYKDKPLVYKAEDGKKLDDINLIIRHIRDMHISTDEKRRLHNRLSAWRTDIEAVVLFGE